MLPKVCINGIFITVKPDDFVMGTKQLRSFCLLNGYPDCIFKSQGGWYIIKKQGKMILISRTLNSLTFDTLFECLKKYR